MVYLPLILVNFFKGGYFTAIGLIILYIITTIVRQIIEPKIVSKSIGIHPVLVLAILYVGFKAMGIVGVVYLMGLTVLYKIFKGADII